MDRSSCLHMSTPPNPWDSIPTAGGQHHQCPWWESEPVSGYILMSRLSCHLFYEETGGGTQRLGFLLGVSCAPHTLVEPSLQQWEYAEELQLSNIHGGQFWWGTTFDNTVASSEGLYKCRLPHSPSNRLQCGGGRCKWASTSHFCLRQSTEIIDIYYQSFYIYGIS